MKTIMHYYRFNLDKEDEKKEYKALCKKLIGMGLKLFDSVSFNHSKWYKEAIKPLDGQEIELETDYLFDNQWNTASCTTSDDGLRVFDWAEAIYSNRDVREGQWLEQTDEMKEERRNRVKCGYCGKQYKAQQGYVFCESCLDSAYLKEKDLNLLRLSYIMDNKYPPLTEAEKGYLMPLYIKRQTEGENSRNVQKLKKQREHIESKHQKNKESNQTEHDGLLWLMDNNVSIENCIYYNHRNIFTFGWRSPLSEDVKSKLLDVLVEFPFEYEIR